MTWARVEKLITDAAEAKEPTLKLPGYGSRFRFHPDADLFNQPRNRGLWFDLRSFGPFDTCHDFTSGFLMMSVLPSNIDLIDQIQQSDGKDLRDVLENLTGDSLFLIQGDGERGDFLAPLTDTLFGPALAIGFTAVHVAE